MGTWHHGNIEDAIDVLNDVGNADLADAVEALLAERDLLVGGSLDLTRADKERAVAEMADRLTIACFHVATSHDRKLPDDPDERADFLADRRSFEWSMYRKQKALVRLAMARTVD